MEEKEKRTIIVKGIDEELKRALKSVADTTGKAMSEVVREALKLYVGAREVGTSVAKEVVTGIKEIAGIDVTTIKGIGELQLNKEDLLGFNKKIVLMNIDKLEFAEDITKELFQEKVEKIVNVKELIIHKTIPKSLILMKSSYIGRITIKE